MPLTGNMGRLYSARFGLHVGRSRELMGQRIEPGQSSKALVRRRYLALLQAAAGPAPTLQRFSVATGLAGLMLSVVAALRGQGCTGYCLHSIEHAGESRAYGSGE
jgi:hypothetical protein